MFRHDVTVNYTRNRIDPKAVQVRFQRLFLRFGLDEKRTIKLISSVWCNSTHYTEIHWPHITLMPTLTAHWFFRRSKCAAGTKKKLSTKLEMERTREQCNRSLLLASLVRP